MRQGPASGGGGAHFLAPRWPGPWCGLPVLEVICGNVKTAWSAPNSDRTLEDRDIGKVLDVVRVRAKEMDWLVQLGGSLRRCILHRTISRGWFFS
jgi:hypothetical protein